MKEQNYPIQQLPMKIYKILNLQMFFFFQNFSPKKYTKILQ